MTNFVQGRIRVLPTPGRRDWSKLVTFTRDPTETRSAVSPRARRTTGLVPKGRTRGLPGLFEFRVLYRRLPHDYLDINRRTHQSLPIPLRRFLHKDGDNAIVCDAIS